ncbi:MAG TPA: glycerophosphodiester phosphodiesterase [Alphaproteobacteria bacterium]|nr:glycerophosphodiester phosphodiesterase [Alphaproteobacteria bacterium]
MTVSAHAADRPFDIEAHRGGRALRPENTLQSFANALAIGVDTLELDMGVTKDGVVVVSHDRHLSPDLARDAHGNYVQPGIPFVTLTLKEVQSYDVGQMRPGSDYAKGFPDQRSVPGARIPTLSEVFALVRRSGNKQVRLNIETKLSPDQPDDAPDPERFVAIVLDLLRKEGFTDRVTIQSFDWRTLQLAQKQAPSIPTSYLTMQSGVFSNVFLDKPSHWTAGFDPMRYQGSLPKAIKAAGGAIWSPFYKDVTPALVQEAHGLGLKVLPWTVNDARTMGDLIDMGADGIISDHPDLLRQVAGEKGVVLPAPAPVTP